MAAVLSGFAVVVFVESHHSFGTTVVCVCVRGCKAFPSTVSFYLVRYGSLFLSILAYVDVL